MQQWMPLPRRVARVLLAGAVAALCVSAAACSGSVGGTQSVASTPPVARSTAPFAACDAVHPPGWEEQARSASDLRLGFNGQRDFVGGALFALRIQGEWCLAYLSDAALDEMFARR